MKLEHYSRNKNLRDNRFIHIVGMYKSGTSWLLHVLANHPEIIAWREFDILRAVYDYERSPLSFKRRAFNKILRLTGLSGKTWSINWTLRERDLLLRNTLDVTDWIPILKDRDAIIRNIFCGRGWIPMLGADKQRLALALDYADPQEFLENLLSIDKIELQPDDSPKLAPGNFFNTLGVSNSRKIDLVKFLQDIILVKDLHDIPSIYFDYIMDQVCSESVVALKAADQLICIKELRKFSPNSKKIIIVRDGRDVALSALAFTKLMSKWEAPWTPKTQDYLHVLSAWALRIALLEKEIKKGDLLIIRYEDLKINFEETCQNLFSELDLPHDINLIKDIKKKTDFKVVSGGRNPGEKAEHLVRSGLIGEWTGELNKIERSNAWRMASDELSLLGYKEDGGFDDWHGCLKLGKL